MFWAFFLSLLAGAAQAEAWRTAAAAAPAPYEVIESRRMIVPVIGTTRAAGGAGAPYGVFYDIDLVWEKRADELGLVVRFNGGLGRFAPPSQTAIEQAIRRAAKFAGEDTKSWSVILGAPDSWATIFGDSLSAMVGLSVVAMSRGHAVPTDRIMTGTIQDNGRIGAVDGIALKIWNSQYRFRRVIIPGNTELTDLPPRNPFLLQVTLASTVADAYQALTDEPIKLTP